MDGLSLLFSYTYHLRVQLKGINLDGSGNPVPNASQGDLFSYRLDYETAFIYDGNIGKQSWQASNNNAPSGLRAYTFTYDNISRLKSATYSGVGSENYSLPTINYDRNGNITSMQRNGKLSSTYGLMDNLTYTYSGNRLMRVEDAVSGNYDVDFVNRNNGTDDYSYYANGALKADKNEDITDIIYSTYANQPIEIQLTGSRWIKNFYDGAGRLYKTSYSTGEYWEYLDGMVFKNGAFYQLATPEGRANYQSGAWGYEYFLTDHLGNTRVAYKATGSALTKTSETSFDPWGVVLKDVGLVNAFQNKFEYQNKEKESTFNLRRISFGARTYNASIGRFDGVDPLADKMRRFSPYNYAFNNPLRFIDPDGMGPKDLIVTGSAIQAFKDQVYKGSAGYYNANVDNNGKVSLVKTGIEMDETAQIYDIPTAASFVTTIMEAIDSKSVITIETVSADPNVQVGSIIDNKVDMADIAEFDNAGRGGASSAGALSHEIKEQQLKAEAGGVKGVYPPKGAGLMHREATKAENRTNGNIRVENQPEKGTDTFYEKDGSKTSQKIETPASGIIAVTKTKIP